MRTVAEIQQDITDVKNEIKFTILQMKEAANAPDSTWQTWSDRHYDLIQQRKTLEMELLKVGRENIKARKKLNVPADYEQKYEMRRDTEIEERFFGK